MHVTQAEADVRGVTWNAPACSSRSTTSTRATPKRRSSIAAARPAGPPPTMSA